MSDYISFEIQEEIIKKLPVESVIRFRSVSKAWKALIDSTQFIAAYSLRQTHPHHLLIRYGFYIGVEDQYISFVDDDPFPEQNFVPTVPLSIKQLQHSVIIGSSGGLLCLRGYYPPPYNPARILGRRMAVLWNPSIRKSVAIDVPKEHYMSYGTVFGFGVCPVDNDPKIVMITHCNILWGEMKNNNNIPLKVNVYTLSMGEWKSCSCNLPRQSIRFTCNHAVIDGFIYWLAENRIAINDGFRISYTIISFDMTTDEFREVYLPDSLTHPTYKQVNQVISKVQVTIFKVRESLAVLEYNMDADKRICGVWLMEDGVPKSFTKLYTIKTPHASITTLGFRKSGEPIMETQDGLDDCCALVVYEPYSKRLNDLGISGPCCSFSVGSYMETLLLLNR